MGIIVPKEAEDSSSEYALAAVKRRGRTIAGWIAGIVGFAPAVVLSIFVPSDVAWAAGTIGFIFVWVVFSYIVYVSILERVSLYVANKHGAAAVEEVLSNTERVEEKSRRKYNSRWIITFGIVLAIAVPLGLLWKWAQAERSTLAGFVEAGCWVAMISIMLSLGVIRDWVGRFLGDE